MRRSSKSIIHEKSKSLVKEAYKTLRTNIRFSFPYGNMNILLVTSSGPGEGKSTTAINLAITMAELDNKVLLLEADLRKPAIHQVFAINNYRGLTNVLVENVDYKEVIQSPDIKNLEILTSGPKPPNPAELLSSSRMKDLLDILKDDYDLIIIDTPPVLAVTDAAVLSPFADGVVLVAAYGKTTFEALNQTKASLEKANARILGVVINEVPLSSNIGYHYYYYYYDKDANRSED